MLSEGSGAIPQTLPGHTSLSLSSLTLPETEGKLLSSEPKAGLDGDMAA